MTSPQHGYFVLTPGTNRCTSGCFSMAVRLLAETVSAPAVFCGCRIAPLSFNSLLTEGWAYTGTTLQGLLGLFGSCA